MVKKILNSITKIKQLYGVDYMINPEGEVLLQVMLLAFEGKSVKVVESKTNLPLAEWKNVADEAIPVALNVSGKGVLVKALSEQQTSIESVLPNLKIAEFYVQQVDQIAAVSRKDFVDPIIDAFKADKSEVISVSLGGLATRSLAAVFPEETGFQTAIHRFEVVQGKLAGVSNSSEKVSYTIGDESVSSSSLSAFAIAFQEFLPGYAGHSLSDERFKNFKEEYAQKRQFKTFGFASLILVFMVLLVNFYFFNDLRDTFNANEEKLGVSETQLSKLRSIQDEVKLKKNFMEQSGWLKPSKNSFHADRIGASVPPSISLTTIEINPRDSKRSKKEKEDIFGSDLISIEGLCKSSYTMNEWINGLKLLEWVDNAEVIEYVRVPGKTKATFTIEVKIKSQPN